MKDRFIKTAMTFRVVMAMLMAIMGLLTIAVPIASAATTVQLTTASVTAGGACTINVLVNGVVSPGLGGYDLSIAFDSTKVTLSSVSGGTASGFTGPPQSGPTGYPSPVSMVTYCAAGSGPTGDLLVAQLNFTAGTTAGTFPLTLTIYDLINFDLATITATAVNGAITILTPPVANFTGTPTTGNTGTLTVNFTDTSTGGAPTSWAWDFKNDGTATSTDQNPSYTYTAPGNYTVKLTATNAVGSDDEVKTNYITVYAPPTAAFSGTPLTSNTGSLTVNFTDASTGNIVSRAWDFDNSGGTPDSTAQNPSYTYSAPGNYTVKLTVTNPAGTDDEIKTNYVTVYAAPTAAFSGTPLTGNTGSLTVNFTDASTGNIVSWAWDFDNSGGTPDSILQNPSYTYSAPGNYTVKLTATNPAGTDDEIKTNYITVYAPPVANFTASPTSGVASLTVNFTDTSTGNIVSRAWDFDNSGGTPDSILQNPSYIYTSPGIYTVKLTVTNPAGTDDEIKTGYITVYSVPAANFTGTPTTSNTGTLTVSFTDTSTGPPTSWAWDFDNSGGTPDSTLQNPSHTYSAPGNYTVKLTATNPAGSDDELKTDYIKVYALPVAAFSGTPLTSNTGSLTVNFTDTSTGNIVSRAWDVNNDSLVDYTTQNCSHTYSAPGNYTVKLVVINPAGTDDEIKTNYITVYAPPVASFTAPVTTSNTGTLTGAHFFDTSTGNIVSWAWDFNNDGTVDSTSQLGMYNYTAPGNYTVKLTVTNPAATAIETKTNYITVYAPPVANFSASVTNGAAPLAVNFTGTSTGNIVSHAWDFRNDGTATSTAQNPSYTYTAAGTYTVKLTVTNPAGTDDEIKTGYITVISFVANIDLTPMKYDNTANPADPLNGIIMLEVKITRTYNPTTGVDVTISGGLGAYDAVATFNSTGVTMVNIVGVAPFTPAVINVGLSDQATFNATQTSSAPQAPITVARLVPRLKGSCSIGDKYNIVLHFNGLVAMDLTEFEESATKTLTFWRGDATNDGSKVSIADALLIAKYLAKLNVLSDLNALNAASINPDGANGDKISVADALALAQKLALRRDAYFNLITTP